MKSLRRNRMNAKKKDLWFGLTLGLSVFFVTFAVTTFAGELEPSTESCSCISDAKKKIISTQTEDEEKNGTSGKGTTGK